MHLSGLFLIYVTTAALTKRGFRGGQMGHLTYVKIAKQIINDFYDSILNEQFPLSPFILNPEQRYF